MDCGPLSAGGWDRETQLADEVMQAGHRLPDDSDGYELTGALAEDLEKLRVELAAGHPID